MPKVIGSAVLRDYPLRLWLRQQEHTDAVLREFSLLLGGHESGATDASPPQQLLALAEMVTTRFGALVTSNRGDLLARPPELAAFADWKISELITQYEGGEPTPWPGPF